MAQGTWWGARKVPLAYAHTTTLSDLWYLLLVPALFFAFALGSTLMGAAGKKRRRDAARGETEKLRAPKVNGRTGPERADAVSPPRDRRTQERVAQSAQASERQRAIEADRRAAARKAREAERRAMEQRAALMRSDARWRQAVLDHYLDALWERPDPVSGSWTSSRHFTEFRGALLDRKDVTAAREAAVRQGLVLREGSEWRLTRRGRRVFEEYAGSRKRMEDAERRRERPHIDARGAGVVAHTINGGVSGTTVDNSTHQAVPEGDLRAALALMERLQFALQGDQHLTELVRHRAAGDLEEIGRELRAGEQERDPDRVRYALERLRVSVTGVDALSQAVHQLWEHVRPWLGT